MCVYYISLYSTVVYYIYIHILYELGTCFVEWQIAILIVNDWPPHNLFVIIHGANLSR